VRSKGSSPSALRRFLTLATDRTALGWQTTVLAFLAYVGLWLRAVIDEGTPVFTSAALGVIAGALILQWLVLWVSMYAFLQRSWWLRHVVVRALFFVIVIVMSGFAVTRGIAVMQPSGWGDAIAQETAGMWFQRAGIFLVIAAAWSAVQTYRRTLAHQRMLQSSLEIARDTAMAEVEMQRADVVQQATDMFHASLDNISAGEPASQSLRSLARDQIRPLSHELATSLPPFRPEYPNASPTTSFWTVVEEVTRRPIIQPILMAAAVTFLFFWQSVSTQPPEAVSQSRNEAGGQGVTVTFDLESFLVSIAFLVAIFLSTWLVGIAFIRLTRWRALSRPKFVRVLWVLFTPLLMALAVRAIVQLLVNLPGIPSTFFSSTAVRLAIVLPIFFIAYLLLLIRTVAQLFTVSQERQEMLTAQLSWEVARAKDTLLQERKFLATALHGPLQSTISAVAMAVDEAERAGKDPDPVWQHARERLTASIGALALGPPQQRRLIDESRTISDTWDGVCDVSLTIPPEAEERLAGDWVGVGTTIDVLTDAVANAVVHGNAKHVTAEIQVVGDAMVQVLVQDDGEPAETVPTSGLGTSHLGEVAIAWNREFTPAGTRLEVLLPAQTV
jgi:signal transduction histidine kinase